MLVTGVGVDVAVAVRPCLDAANGNLNRFLRLVVDFVAIDVVVLVLAAEVIELVVVNSPSIGNSVTVATAAATTSFSSSTSSDSSSLFSSFSSFSWVCNVFLFFVVVTVGISIVVVIVLPSIVTLRGGGGCSTELIIELFCNAVSLISSNTMQLFDDILPNETKRTVAGVVVVFFFFSWLQYSVVVVAGF